MHVRQVTGTDGTRLALYEHGQVDQGPVLLFVHGWAQSARCWDGVMAGELVRRYHLAAVDLRGHGASDAPDGGYRDPAVWAADLATVLDALPDRPVVLVGWSYGGLVIADHIAACGRGRVAGVVLVGAITGIGRGRPAGRVGPVMRAALPDALSDDPAVAVPALTAFVTGMDAALTGPQVQRLLGAALATPPHVRAALFDRVADGAGFARVTGETGLPVLVLHGTDDPVVDRAAAEHHLATLPGAGGDWWEGHGHLPFLADEPRFAAALDAFVTGGSQ